MIFTNTLIDRITLLQPLIVKTYKDRVLLQSDPPVCIQHLILKEKFGHSADIGRIGDAYCISFT